MIISFAGVMEMMMMTDLCPVARFEASVAEFPILNAD